MVLNRFRKVRSAAQIAASPRLITAAALCWTVCTMAAAPHVASQTAYTEQHPPEKTTQSSAPSEPDDEADPVKLWLITPTLSADPKLGANVGGIVAYLKKMDERSTTSMVGASVSYSDTDSITGGVGAQLFWGADTRRLMLLAVPPRSTMSTTTLWAPGRKPKPRMVFIPLGFGISSR
jgi:hypothetical protein